MKIVVPVDEDQKTVCIVFGRSPFFMVYDSDTEKYQIVENLAASAQGGAGIKAAQSVVDLGADCLITVRCGENSAEILKAAEVQIYKSNKTDAKLNIEELKEGTLFKLTHFHGGYHGAQ